MPLVEMFSGEGPGNDVVSRLLVEAVHRIGSRTQTTGTAGNRPLHGLIAQGLNSEQRVLAPVAAGVVCRALPESILPLKNCESKEIACARTARRNRPAYFGLRPMTDDEEQTLESAFVEFALAGGEGPSFDFLVSVCYGGAAPTWKFALLALQRHDVRSRGCCVKSFARPSKAHLH